MSENNPLFRLSDASYAELPGFARTFRRGELTVGLSLPIEESAEESPEDSLDNQVRLIRKAEDAGFAAVWVRDIPLRVETFGDVGQVWDPWMYLSYLAARTSTIALGTAAVVVPFQHPLLMAKRAATLDRLSGGRFLFGIATGDRPEEFPAFGQDRGTRGDVLAEHLRVYREAMTTSYSPIRWSGGKMGGADVVPKPSARDVPLLATGSLQQTMQWRAEHTHGWLMYHKGLELQKVNVDNWNAAVDTLGGGWKPFAESLWLDLHPNPDAEAEGHHFGYRLGRNALIRLLRKQREIGISHVMVNFRISERDAEEQIDEFIQYVMPEITPAD
ncbi:LLM class oxidoreductase [Corynebacterium sanguinis]|uniref:LLM class oxidoreductase n=1 Tax=Corynebacterium sanguinis TaxID=2594913 RepID=UPI0010AB4104|nr:LLM class oxidoreductase [Corynebacterium sanguinis]MCT1614838.1 LLM class oxidoreductase [Corynebacterium sanguinis]MCT1696219.1 LLM class oxidoreductase [Corynebacterium sanguinis]MCT1715624.1 LLM class oxidoreductase [Corynebacterium sanguinis]MCT2251604.1 LLM class oxidoreductase [Corynebacterium sanguinis]TVS23240.1 LLM class oxidoreductase [Corynebacterium sanguinis]